MKNKLFLIICILLYSSIGYAEVHLLPQKVTLESLGAAPLANPTFTGTVTATGNLAVGTITTATAINPSLTVTGRSTSSADTAFKVQNSVSSPGLVVLNDGKVGVGTTTPQTQLTIKATVNDDGIRVYGSTTPQYYAGIGCASDGSIRLIGNNTAAYVYTQLNGYVVTGTAEGNGILSYRLRNPAGASHIDFYRSALNNGIRFYADSDMSNSASMYLFDSEGAGIGELSGSGVHQNWMSFEPDINQTGTSSYTALNVDVTETATGSGIKALINLQKDGSSKFMVDSGGNVGIGTTTPSSMLYIYDTNIDNVPTIFQTMGAGASSNSYRDGFVCSTTGQNGSASVSIWASPTGGHIQASLYAVSYDHPLSLQHLGGKVGIGTTTPATALHVIGTVTVSSGIVVAGTTMNVPDYVFEPEYKLLPIEELREYVEVNRHLPEFESAKDTQSLNLVQDNMRLREAIEKLTLYLFEMKEEIADLRGRRKVQ